MNLTSLKVVKTLLLKYMISPSKQLGQNFLTDKGAIDNIIKAACLGPDDIVLEIGPGLGTLTQEIAKKAKKVIGVEKDPKMVEIMGETLKDIKNSEIIQEDILKFKDCSKTKNYKLMGNLPFYLTSPIIRKFLERKNKPEKMILLVQKEMGQRICAKPPDMSILAVSVQIYSKPEIMGYVPKKSFWPQPKVDSAIIKIVPRIISETSSEFASKTTANGVSKNPTIVSFFDSQLFFRIVKAGFSQPRKQLVNNLSKGLNIKKEKALTWLEKNNIKSSRRAETLSIQDWINLSKTIK